MEQKIHFKKQYRVELAETLQGHYYSVWEKKKKEKFLGHFVSVTTILNAFPTSEQLVKWISAQGFHESRQIRDAAGRAGSRIHSAIEALIKGSILEKLSYTTEEWIKIKSFVDWFHEYKPEIIATEIKIFSPKYKYCGTIDCVAKIADEVQVIDWKSSRSIHASAFLQVAAYSQALEETTDVKVGRTSIVQLGASNKNGYRFVLEDDWHSHFQVFLGVKKTWEYDTGYDKGKEPPVLVLPAALKLERSGE